jgi:MFS family permease
MRAFNGLFIPARQAALPQIVEPDQLVPANSLISLIGVIANFIGLPIAGFIVSIFGATSSIILNCLGFLVSAWCIFHIRKDLSPSRRQVSGADEVASWGGTLSGLRVLQEKPELGALSMMAIVAILQTIVQTVDLQPVHLLVNTLTKFLSMFAPKPPVFEIHMLAFGIVMAAIGVGLGGGAGLCGLAPRASRSKAIPYVALALLGGTLVGFAYLTEYWPVVVGAMFMGVVSAFIVIPIQARLQNDVDNARRGRLFALLNLCTTVTSLLGLAMHLNGELLEKIGPVNLIRYIGVGAIAIALVLALANASTLRTSWSTHPPK